MGGLKSISEDGRIQRECITKISVNGFKSIAEECSIDIRPLTILAGANSSGKSSIMQPLLMLKQTLEAPYDPGPLLIDGPNVRFTSASQFLSRLIGEKNSNSFQIGIGTGLNHISQLVKLTLKNKENGFEIVEMTIENLCQRRTLRHGMSPVKISLSGNGESILEEEYIATKRSRCSLHLESKDGHSVTIIASHEFHASNTIHLPGLRGNPERIYKRTSTGPQYPGTFENYAASIMHEWQETEDEHMNIVVDALSKLGLTRAISTKKISDIGIELQVDRFRSGDITDMVNIADVGFGVSQVLPVVVALAAAEQGQLVYIEQPELHLHPRAQVALARVLTDAAKRGIRVVAETHSSLLLLGIQTLVAEGDLPSELVKLHWFTRSEDGVTEVASADLDEAGAYGEWPEDFDDVDLKAQSRYIKAAQSRFVEGT